MEDTIDNEDWKLNRYKKEQVYVYEFWCKVNGRYIKYVQDGDDIVVIEDGVLSAENLTK